MQEREKIQAFKTIDFGDVDANADPNLDKYFIDDDYWNRIISEPIYYVVGKKGTGKSALYKMLERYSMTMGALVSNCDFGDFPFNKLMQLSDDDYTKPNQYQSVWELVILNQIVSLVISSESADCTNIYYSSLKDYFDQYLGETLDLHKLSVTRMKKNDHSLSFTKGIFGSQVAHTTESTMTYGDSFGNITAINKSLLSTLTNYFKTTDLTSYIVQFDRLDDTYNQYAEIDTYLHVIISLMKTVYKINNHFRSSGIENVKTIVYLRSDIIDEIGKRDSESARWEDFTYRLSWAIVNKNDWINPPLKLVIDKRIQSSLNMDIRFENILDSKTICILRSDVVDVAQDDPKTYMDVFKYIVELTMHRPRDIIKFCKCIQNEVKTSSSKRINYRTIKNAEKEFCYWLVNAEISNEINPVISNVNELFNLLRALGSKPFTFNDFYLRYKTFGNSITTMDKDKLIEYLYDVGILMNVNRRRGRTHFKSKIRNRGSVDRSMKLMIHTGVWKGINA